MGHGGGGGGGIDANVTRLQAGADGVWEVWSTADGCVASRRILSADPRGGLTVLPCIMRLQAATLLKSVTAEAKTDYDAALKAELTGASMPPAADKKKVVELCAGLPGTASIRATLDPRPPLS